MNVIKPLTPILFGQNQPYTFDTDTKTLPELCALLHGKMNETVAAFNELEEKMAFFTQDHVEKVNQAIQVHETALRQEFQDFIDTVDLKLQEMDSRLKHYDTVMLNVTHYYSRVQELETKVAALEAKAGV